MLFQTYTPGGVDIRRPRITRSGRIRVTETLIRRTSPDRVLELGAGDYSFDYCQEKRPGRTWVKVDFVAPCDLLCDFNTPNVAIPAEASSFDCIVCTEVIEHILWPHALLRECHRLLAPTGVLVVSVPNCVSITYRIAWMLGRIPSCAACGNLPVDCGPTSYVQTDGGMIGGHVIDYNRERLRVLLGQCGFRIVCMKGSGVFWRKQVLPAWLVPVSLSSNLVAVCARA